MSGLLESWVDQLLVHLLHCFCVLNVGQESLCSKMLALTGNWCPQVASMGSLVDIVISRLPTAASTTASASTSAATAPAAAVPDSSRSLEASAAEADREKAHAAEVKRLQAAVKAADAAAKAAAEGQEYAAARLLEADQRLIELEAARDEVINLMPLIIQVCFMIQA